MPDIPNYLLDSDLDHLRAVGNTGAQAVHQDDGIFEVAETFLAKIDSVVQNNLPTVVERNTGYRGV